MRLARLAFTLCVVCLLVAIPAIADTVTYTVNVPNTALSAYTGPYASVTVDLTSSTTATITFDSLVNGGNIYLLGGNSAVGVNVNATSWTIGSFTGTNTVPGFSPGALSSGGSKNVSSFGVFNQTVDEKGGFTTSSTEITFILTNTSGTWANAASVLAANADGNAIEIHAFVCVEPCDVANGAANTGFASTGNTPVPEPASLLLFGSGLVGVAGLVRRKRK